jgi:SAM-dependent methyltransferase
LKELFRNSVLHPRFLAHREIRRVLRAEAAALAGRMLDVGCGTKPYRGLFPRVSAHIGVDTPHTMHGLRGVDAIGTASALPFGDGCFDCVLCTEVLEHTPEPSMALREIGRVTRPGGSLLLTVPLSEQLHEEPRDFYRFTHHGIGYLLRQAGWRVVRVHRRGGPWLEIGYRLSSLLYSALGARPGPDGRLRARPILGPLVVAACAALQVGALALDALWKPPLTTIGYGVLAEKPRPGAGS